jgi:predicted dehydrogenase
MEYLRACFVGVGSIAKRHIKNLYEICNEQKIGVKIDALRSGNKKLPEDIETYISNIYYNETELPAYYDVIFITNPTDYHIDTLKKVHNKARHFFIEKPITSYKKLESVHEISYREDSVYYVACPLRYTNVIQYLKNNVKLEEVISVRCISSSYLPDWRPGVDYRDTYSAHKELGGGVSIDLIHEWDYIQYIFGKPEKILCSLGKKSNLEIDCEDYAYYIAEYKDKVVELHLDYFGRKPIREIMLFTKADTIVGDLVNSKVKYLKSGKIVDFSEDRNDFQKKELKYFLSLLIQDNVVRNYVLEAYNTMKYTQGVVE